MLMRHPLSAEGFEVQQTFVEVHCLAEAWPVVFLVSFAGTRKRDPRTEQAMSSKKPVQLVCNWPCTMVSFALSRLLRPQPGFFTRISC